MTTPIALPTSPQERIQLLDVIRGFALVGILLMNIEYFQRPMLAMSQGFNSEVTGLDYATAWSVFVFVQGKFYTMFSMLFGIGFVLFLDRAMQKSASPRWLFIRRTLVLGLFGAAHMLFVWTGDILLTYALAGLLLLIFASTAPAKLWKCGLALIVLPVAMLWLGVASIQTLANSPEGGGMIDDMLAQQQHTEVLISQGEQLYATGGFIEVMQFRLTEIAILYNVGNFIFVLMTIVGTMLVGASLARFGIFTRPAEHRKTLTNMLVIGALLGVPSALYTGFAGLSTNMLMPDYTTALVFTLQTLANISLCLAYMAALALLFVHASGIHRLFIHLAPAGRMALTNYLTHSLVFTWLFYGYGLGLYGEYGRFSTTLMAIGLFAAQLAFSRWWLQRYQYGPLEWVWRSATYLKWQPLRHPQNKLSW